MKTWLWAALALVVGFLVYRGWFAPGDVEESAAPPPVLEVPGAQPEPESPPVSPSPLPPRPRIDLAPGETVAPAAPPRDEAAWAQEAERREALQKGDTQRAEELGRLLLRDHPRSDPARWIHYDLGREQLQRYQRLGRSQEGMAAAREAWRHLTPVLFLTEAQPAEKATLRETLGKLARDLLFAPRHVEGVDKTYVPMRGDSLSVLCRKVFPQWGAKTSPGFVVEVNGLRSARDLRAGEPIKVPLGEPEIVIVKSEYRLYFLLDGGYVRDFAVGLGKEGTTPEAQFVVEEKIKNPAWNPRAGVVIPYGDPRNILGTRWMAFKNNAEYRGLGIHGTSDPASIGRGASAGCVRMLREDVERLFAWTPRGTRVSVLR
ncbi:MAG: L,D-transpeptidase [Planctomycetota bacterium]|jgi:hypothetical protein